MAEQEKPWTQANIDEGTERLRFWQERKVELIIGLARADKEIGMARWYVADQLRAKAVTPTYGITQTALDLEARRPLTLQQNVVNFLGNQIRRFL